MSVSWDRITAVFGAARLLEDDRRGAFLDVACAEDPVLRTEVERLLADASRDDSFLAGSGWAADTQSASGSLAEGDVLENRYRIQAAVATGGQARVYRAMDAVLSRPVIVKVLRAAGAHNRALTARFEQEMRALTRIDHPGVVGILDVGHLADGCPFLVIQHVDGVSLRDELNGGALDAERTARILRELGSALSAAHAAGVAHQDLKPENIMLQRLADGTEAVKLIDFGISKIDRADVDGGLTTVMIAGTVRYMAPEQFEGRSTHASDTYALALVACEMLCGHPDVRALPASVSSATRRLLEGAVAYRPEDRPQELRRWCDELAGAIAGGGARRRRVIAVAAALLVVGAVSLAGARYLPGSIPEPRRVIEKTGAFDPLVEGFQTHNEITGTVSQNPERNGYDGWKVTTPRQGHYFANLTPVEKRLALERGWTLTVVMRAEEGLAFAGVDFNGVGRRYGVDVHRNGTRELVRLYTQIVPTFQGLDYRVPVADDEYHKYELRYDAGLKAAALWIDGIQRIAGYTGHSQFQGDGDLHFGVATYESAQGVASFQTVRFEINP